MSRSWYVRRLITVPGAMTLESGALAEQLRRHLDETAEKEMIGLAHHACAESRVRRRHLEIDADRRPGDSDAEEARLSLARRALRRLLGDEEAPDVLVVVSRGGSALAEQLLPNAKALPRRVVVAAHPSGGLLLAHSLLAAGSAQRVAVLCADVAGTEAWDRLRRASASVSALIAATLASDGAAGVVLSSTPGPDPRLIYSDMLPVPRAGGTMARPRIAGRDATELRDRLINEIGAWADDAAVLPTLVLPGGAALLDVLAKRHPTLKPMVTVSRAVFEENGQLGAASGLWLLDAALREGMRLDPAFRLVATGPGFSTHALVLEGVNLHVRA